MLEEKDLVSAIQSGNEDAFRILVERYKQLVFNVSFHFTQSHSEADDLAQEVFIQVWESIDNFQGDSKFSTWLYRVAVNKSLDFVRAQKRRQKWGRVQSLFSADGKTIASPAPNSETPDAILEHSEQMEMIWKCLQKLPENHKTAFILNKYDNLSYKEISEIMNISLSAVETNIHRAKEKLKKDLRNTFYF